jgi:predicted metalloprotease
VVKRRVWKIGLLLLLVLGLVGPGALRAGAQQSDTESNVSGNSYTSPTYGYSVSWDTTWEVANETSEQDVDSLQITNGVSTVYFDGYAFTGDEAACLTSAVESLGSEDGVSDFKQAQSDSGPLEGTDTFGTWAVYDLTYTAEDGTESSYSEFVICRAVVPDEAMLQITQVVPTDSYNDELDGFAALVDSVTLSGEPPSGPAGTAEAEETPAPSNSGELETWLLKASDDIDGFWTRQFPALSGGKDYEPPKEYVPYSDETTTPCGDAVPGAMGGDGWGPFYCPLDDKIYLDTLFAQSQWDQYGAFPVAEAIAHEVGHHVQYQLGMEVCEQSPCLDPTEVTSQELEVMADCFAGAWSQDAEARGRLGNFDIEANIVEYSVVLGDPVSSPGEPGAHGRGALRIYWFLNGYYNGPAACLNASPATSTLNDQTTPEADNGDNEAKNTPEITPETTATAEEEVITPEATEATEEAGTTLQIGDEAKVGSVTLSATGTDTADSTEAGNRQLIVYITVVNNGRSPAALDYSAWFVVDSDGFTYAFDEAATNDLVSTAVDNGIDEKLAPGDSYDLAIVYDVPTDASGFSLVPDDGSVVIELDQ